MLVIMLSIYSCGKSPLLNHQKESDQLTQSSNQVGPELILKNSQLFLKVSWLKGPYPLPTHENQLLIIVQNYSGDLVELPLGSQFYLWGWMPSMGHGTADDGFTEEVSKGIYIHRELYFNMGGDWDLNIELHMNNQTLDSAKIKLEL